jgi:DNA-binding MarR family transcriptional regulator
VRQDHAKQALIDECTAAVRRLTGMLARGAHPAWLDLDMTMGQLKAMMALVATGPKPVGELGRALDIAEPSASLLVDKLEAQGLATREADSGDRRRTLVKPTAAAQEIFDRLQQVRNEQLAVLLERLPDDELRAVAAGVRALERAAQAVQSDGEVAP